MNNRSARSNPVSGKQAGATDQRFWSMVSGSRVAIALGALLLAGFSHTGAAVNDDESSAVVLIQNVRLIDSEERGEDPLVNIVIRAGKLDLITKDAFIPKETTLTVDAERGFLLGRLEIGLPPSFLVLNNDPRIDFSVLLDTESYTRFAVRDGEIVLNKLPSVVLSGDSELARSEATWLAYTPPPLALPTGYRNSRKWNRWETPYVSGIFAGMVAIDRMRWLSQDSNSTDQVGDLAEFTGGEIRGLRFGAVGTLNFEKPWVYSVLVANNGFDGGFDAKKDDQLTFYDVRLDIPFYAGTTLSLGKQKEPISLSRLMPLIQLPMQERAGAIDAMLPARNTGIVLSGNALGSRVSWAAGMFNNWLDGDESFSDTSTQLIGRLTGIAFASPDRSNLLHLGFGLRSTNAKQEVRYVTEPEFKQAPDFVDTGLIAADGALTWNLEAAWRRGPLLLMGEYLQSDVDSALAGDPSFRGYYLSGVWALTGEMRSYNTKGGVFSAPPVARTVFQDGWGAWELMFRYSSTDMTDAVVEGGNMDILSVGARWWLTRFFSIDMNYRYVTLDRLGVTGDSSGFMTRIVLSLE